MEVIPFIRFCFNRRFIWRWILPGAIVLVPVANFLSLGYLARLSGLTLVGGMGIPTWERKAEIFREGAKLFLIFILYEALPFFFFSSYLFLSNYNNIVIVLLAKVMLGLGLLALVLCSFFLPFAFSTFVELVEIRGAFEFEKVTRAVKEVLFTYVVSYLATLILLVVVYQLRSIPYIGFILSFILFYFVLFVATYQFTQLFKKTSLSSGNIQAIIE